MEQTEAISPGDLIFVRIRNEEFVDCPEDELLSRLLSGKTRLDDEVQKHIESQQ